MVFQDAEDEEMVMGPDGTMVPKDPKDKTEQGKGLNTSTVSGGVMGYSTKQERRPVKVTPSLEMLQQSRQMKANRDVEDEFAKM